jgi:predicted transcriptional regulator
MTVVATSLKLPAALKKRLESVARDSGLTPHAVMVAAIEQHVIDAEKYRQFVADAEAADTQMQKSGKGYDFDEVRAYLEARFAGKRVRRPRLKAWRP